MLLWWKVRWLVLSLQEMTLFPHYPSSSFGDWKRRSQDYSKSRFWIQYDMTKRSRVLAQETKRERFQNIMINNSFRKWNYSSMCSFLVNWIPEEKHSHNIFGRRVIMIGFRVIMIFIVFISPWYNWVRRSVMLLATAPWWIIWKYRYWWAKSWS